MWTSGSRSDIVYRYRYVEVLILDLLQAIKDLPTLCKDQHAKNLPKIVDVLVQLLQSEDQQEVTVIQNSIMTLIRRDTRGAIIGIFSQIHTGEEVVRERAIRSVMNLLGDTWDGHIT